MAVAISLHNANNLYIRADSMVERADIRLECGEVNVDPSLTTAVW